MPTDYENSTQKTGSIAGKECPCATEEMLKIKKQYQQIVDKGRTVGANWASKMLEHWMQGSGKDMIIKTKVLRDYEQIQDAENAIRERILEGIKKRNIINGIKEGEEKRLFLFSHEPMTAMPWSEMFYASGSFTLTGRLTLNVKRNGQIINFHGVLEFHWWDPYDWHAGLNAYIPTVGTVEDADADKYENAGCAKKFDMYSFWYQTFSETYTIDDILWFYDTDKINWGKINEGRPSIVERGSLHEWDNYQDTYMKLEDYGHTAVYQGGRYLPGLTLDKNERETVQTSNPPQRRDREERSRENQRRDRRRDR